jgi:hypothetical protein
MSIIIHFGTSYNTQKKLVVKVHEPSTRVSLALEGLKFMEVKFCKREQKKIITTI